MKKKSGLPTHLTDWDIQLMAWHEAGHAVVAYFLPETEPVESVSIEGSRCAFGITKSAKREKMNMTYQSCLSDIAVAMSGRLSEEMFQNEVTSSCVHDLSKIQFIAMQMVCDLGMGKRTGMITWRTQADESSFLLFSEKQRNDVYEDVKDIITEAENMARVLLQKYAKQVKLLAEELLKSKTIHASGLAQILE